MPVYKVIHISQNPLFCEGKKYHDDTALYAVSNYIMASFAFSASNQQRFHQLTLFVKDTAARVILKQMAVLAQSLEQPGVQRLL